jgi:hypothetical protein
MLWQVKHPALAAVFLAASSDSCCDEAAVAETTAAALIRPLRNERGFI